MIYYAVNERTKKHVRISNPDAAVGVSSARGVNDGDVWRIVEADDDGWIPWGGGECPLPRGAAFEWRCRDGSVHGPQRAVDYPLLWRDGLEIAADEVVAYRPILDEPSEPEAVEWSGNGLPPVGCECECTFAVENHDTWHKGVVTLRGVAPEGHEIVAIDTGDYTAIYRSTQFIRPIRSEEDRLTDEALEEIEADGDDKRTIRSTVARMIHAGYRKG